MRYSLKTDKGIVRSSNQDSCFVTVFDEKTCFAIVCDGMGGQKAGDVASRIAVSNISERFVAGWRKDITVPSVKNLLTTAIAAANICVYDAAQADKELNGMGTTLVAAVALDGKLVIANVGDSRAYLVSDELKLLTKDHSLVQQLIDNGELSAAQAREHPYKNYITRALGVDEQIEIDFSEHKFNGGESVLLCSDGLTNFVTEKDILEIIKTNTVAAAAGTLVNEANRNGGGDNITAVVFSE